MNPAKLRNVLGTPELAWVLDRLVYRIEQGQALVGSLRLGQPSPAQREALARLLGRYGRGEALVLSLEELGQTLLQAEAAESLEQAVTMLRGPIHVRAEVRARSEAGWDAVFAGATHPAWAEIRRSGLLKRLCQDDPAIAHTMVQQTRRLLIRLPVSLAADSTGQVSPELRAENISLAELAATTGDAHALDVGRALATLVLRIALWETSIDPADRRPAWAALGVDVDPLSSTLLVLGLRARGDGLAARLMRACADAGEPCCLTLRQLRTGLDIEGETIFGCENPAVVLAAAERLGAASAPLVCVEGQPNSAAFAVLDAIGCRLRYHGDFDWPGMRIARAILERTGGKPWRLEARDYALAPPGLPLHGDAVTTPWDPALQDMMRTRGVAVHEEAVLTGLLADLAGVNVGE